MTEPEPEPLVRVRAACLALPEATERLSHGSPTWFVRGKKTFVMYLDDHHGDGRLALRCAAPPGLQAELVEQEPMGCARRRSPRDTASLDLRRLASAATGTQDNRDLSEPPLQRFFRPPYVGHRGWIGVRLDRDPDWDEIAAICEDAYRQVAPKSLIARLD